MATVRRLMLSALLAGGLVGAAPVAGRADEPAVVKTLLDGYAFNLQVRPTYQSIETAPDGTITIKGLTFSAPEGVNAHCDAETVTLKGVNAVADQGFEVANADYAGMTCKLDGEMVAAVPAINMTGYIVRALSHNPTELQKAFASSTMARTSTVPQAVVLFAGKSLTIEKIATSFDGNPWSYNGTQHVSIGRVAIPKDILAMGGDQMPLKQLGYSDLEFSSDSTVKVDFTPKAMSFTFDLGLTGKDMGTLHIAASVADLPLALIDAARNSENKPDPEKLVALANGISVSDLRLSFSDSSLTNRLIDFFAASQKMDRAQIIASTAASIQLALIDLKNQDFTNKVIAAVSAFLTTPGSLRVIAAAAPVKVEQMLQSENDPAALLKLLQVDVQANQ